MLKKIAAEINFRIGRRRKDVPTLRRAAMQNIYDARAAFELARLGIPENVCATLLSSLSGLRTFATSGHLGADRKEVLRLMIRYLEISRGQFFQDIAALYFSEQKRNGFFVEVGTGNGELLSNTHMLEKQFEWQGVLFEPDRRFHDSIRRLRSARLDTRPAFSHDDQSMEFLEVSRAGELSTLSNYKREDGRYRTGSTYTVQTITLTSALRHYDAPRDIDYVSIDTEGSELEVLKGCDLNAYNIRFLTIEHNFTPRKKEAIAEYLRPYGYHEVLPEFSYHDIWLLKG